MAAKENKICVFSLSKADVHNNGLKGVLEWLQSKKKAPSYYHFRNHAPKDLAKGSIVLFSFEGLIFGQAIVKGGIKETPTGRRQALLKAEGFDYQLYLTLDESSIDIFRLYPQKRDVTVEIQKEFGRLFTYLNWGEYLQVLKMAGSKPLSSNT